MSDWGLTQVFMCTCQDSLVSLFPKGNASSRHSCFYCISGIPTCIWRVEFKVVELAFWVLLNLYIRSAHFINRIEGESRGGRDPSRRRWNLWRDVGVFRGRNRDGGVGRRRRRRRGARVTISVRPNSGPTFWKIVIAPSPVKTNWPLEGFHVRGLAEEGRPPRGFFARAGTDRPRKTVIDAVVWRCFA